MNRIFRTQFLFFLFLSFLPNFLFALEIPKKPEGYVSDYAGMLSPAKRAQLEETLRHFEEATTNQVAVVTFPSLEEESLEDFSIRLAEAWKIGQKGKDNGVILLIFKNDRKVRIEVGYGLEAVLPDATCKLIIENEIVPRFREGKFDEGIDEAVGAIVLAAQGEYRREDRRPLTDSQVNSFIGAMLLGALLGLLMPIIVLQFLFVVGLLHILFGTLTKDYVDPIYGFLLGVLPLIVYFISLRPLRTSEVLSRDGSLDSGRGLGGGLGGFGGTGFGGTGIGGGFGGGGGGFGGGGASGRW